MPGSLFTPTPLGQVDNLAVRHHPRANALQWRQAMFNPPSGQHGFFCPTREASKTDHTEFFPDGHGYELVSSVRALVPQKFSVEEELMYVKNVEVKSPHVGVMWKFGRGVISSGIVLVT
ncbi:hypothetical protein TNCV_2049611 [Trichonephila clavipes]|nr:hypothetical protein TNCV_2049611 [Trichonephila clavipes]